MPKYVVRFGSMRQLGVFGSRGPDEFKRGDHVIARTNRGLEVGEVLCEATEQATKAMKDPAYGNIQRRMSDSDTNEWSHVETTRFEKLKSCQAHIKSLELDMQLVDIEQLFGGERIIVYYLAEQRVDFRELVKLLASDFQTRIEMKQIGVRDEAKILADYGDCGQPVCCGTFLNQMPPVSMKMAKVQKATLDPNKISGKCGRLKCCLRYEYDVYEEIQKTLPPIGSQIATSEGKARVLNQEILNSKLLIETEDRRRVVIGVDEVESIIKKGSGRL